MMEYSVNRNAPGRTAKLHEKSLEICQDTTGRCGLFFGTAILSTFSAECHFIN